MKLSAVFNLNTVANTSGAQSAMAALTDKVRDTANSLGVAASNAAKLARSGIASRLGGGGGGGGSGGGGGGGGLDPEEHRQRRGVMGSRKAAGRDFAGMVGAGDTSGFVAAYATVASTLFALTAAFQALNNAAKFDQLTKGLQLVGAQAGVTLSLVAKNVREITDFGLSTSEAMRVTAQATTSGIDATSIARLAGVAKGASQALGRDLSDSMDRLVRGVSKLEPELLDELGIMTRLDDAMRAYAIANNKTASSLTITEKKQAFLNAVMEEGERKFKSISEQIPVNQYDKLIASLKDLGTTFATLTNTILTPFIKIFTLAPATAILPFLGVISMAAGKVMPSFGKSLKDINNNLDIFAKKYDDITTSLQHPSFTTVGQGGTAEAIKRLKKEQLRLESSFNFEGGLETNREAFQKSLIGEANVFNILKKSGAAVGDAFEHVGFQTKALNTSMAAAGIKVGFLTKATNFLTFGMRAAGAAAVTLAITFDTLLPWIGIIIAIGSSIIALYDMMKSETQKRKEELKKDLQEILKNSKEVGKQINLLFAAGSYAEGIQAAANNMNELISKARELRDVQKEIKDSSPQQISTSVGMYQSTLGRGNKGNELDQTAMQILDRYETIFGRTGGNALAKELVKARKAGKDIVPILEKANLQAQGLGTAFTNIGDSAKKGGDAVRKYYGESLFKTKYSDIAESFREINNEITSIQQSGAQNKSIAIFDKLKAGGREYLLELDRISGNNQLNLTKNYDYIIKMEGYVKNKQVELAKAKTKEQKIAIQKAIEDAEAAANRSKGIIVGLVTDGGLLIKGIIEEQRVLFDQTSLSTKKLALNYGEIASSIAKVRFEITNLNRDTAKIKLVGSYKSPVDESTEKAFQLAKFEYDNAKKIAALKNNVIQAEYDLNKSELQLAIFKANEEVKLLEASGLNEKNREEYDLKKKIVEELNKQFNLQERIKNASIAQNNGEVKLSKAKLDNTEATRDAYNSEYDVQTRLLDLAKMRQEFEQKILDIKKESNTLAIDIAEQEARNSARKQGIEFDSTPFAIQRLQQDINNIRRSLLQQVFTPNTELQALRNQIKQEEKLTTFASALGGTVPQQRQDLINKLKEQEANLVKELAERLKLTADQIEHLNKQLEGAIKLDITQIMQNLLTRGRGDRDTSRASFGMNIMGAGAQFQQVLNAYLEETKTTAAVALADPAIVKTLNDTAIALKNISLEAEAFDTISASINNNMISAFQGIIDGSMSAGQAFNKMAQAILADIAAMIAQMLVFKLIETGLNVIDPSGGASAFFKGLVERKANGGIMPMASGGVMSRAQGIQGIISKPTYLVGEGRYNEAVVPLPNGREIPVQLQGNSSNSNNIQVNVNMTGNGGQATTETQGQDMDQLGRAVAAAVQRELINQKRPGGILSRYGAA